MTRFIALFFAASSTTAFAQPVVEVGATCPGPATIVVDNLTPNGKFAVQFGEHLYPTEISGGACAGTQNLIDYTDSTYRRRILSADASGSAKFDIPEGAAPCGKEIQVLDITSCEITWPKTIGYEVCNQPLTVVETQADVDAISQCRQIGLLQSSEDMNGQALSELSLPNLEAVRTFDSTYSAANYPDLNLDALTFIGDFTAAVAGNLHFPALVHATKVGLQGDAAAINMPLLETIGESLDIINMPTLKFINLPSLREIGNGMAPFNLGPAGNTTVIIQGNDSLAAVNLRSLEYANRLLVRDNPNFCPDATQVTWPDWNGVYVDNQVAIYNNATGCDVTLLP